MDAWGSWEACRWLKQLPSLSSLFLMSVENGDEIIGGDNTPSLADHFDFVAGTLSARAA
jgi:hypothetical protein